MFIRYAYKVLLGTSVINTPTPKTCLQKSCNRKRSQKKMLSRSIKHTRSFASIYMNSNLNQLKSNNVNASSNSQTPCQTQTRWLSSLDIRGVYPPIVTPFSADGSENIAWDKLDANINAWNNIPFRGS